MARRALMVALLAVFAAPLAGAQQSAAQSSTDAGQAAGDTARNPASVGRWFYIAEGVRWGAAVADFETTRRYVPAGLCVESAPLLGREPSAARVYGVGVAAEAGVTLTLYLLQRHLRRHSPEDKAAALIMLEGSITAAHAYSAAHNGRCL